MADAVEPQVRKNIYEMDAPEIVEFLNTSTDKYATQVIKNKVIDSEDYTSPEMMSDEVLFNIFFGFEYVYRTEDGAKLMEKLTEFSDQLYGAALAELQKRLGRDIFGIEYLV